MRQADVWINTTPARPLSHAGQDAAPAARSHFMAARDKRNIRLGRLRHPLREFSGPNPMFDLISTSVGRPCIASALQPPPVSQKVSSFIYRCGRGLDIERNESPARASDTAGPSDTSAHPPEGLLLQRRHPPPPPTQPTHSLAPSLQCAKVWHAVKKNESRRRKLWKKTKSPGEKRRAEQLPPSTPTLL